MCVCVGMWFKFQEVGTSAEQRALLALRQQLDQHGLADLRDGQSSCFVGFNEGDVYIDGPPRPRGHRGHLPGYHWKKTEGSLCYLTYCNVT